MAKDGFVAIGARNPANGPFCVRARARIVELAAAGDLTVPLACTFAFEDARDAVAVLAGPRPGGKLALVPGARCRDWPRYDAGLLASGWTAWSWRAKCLSPT